MPGDNRSALSRAKKPSTNPFGQPQFQFYELVSAGPDRKFGTKDDLKLDDVQKFQQLGSGRLWFLGDDRLETASHRPG